MRANFDWKDALEQLFSGSLNQSPIDDAARLMANFSSVDDGYHEEIMFLFQKGKLLVEQKDEFILHCINTSGYQVNSFEGARHLIAEYEGEYLKAYEAERHKQR